MTTDISALVKKMREAASAVRDKEFSVTAHASVLPYLEATDPANVLALCHAYEAAVRERDQAIAAIEQWKALSTLEHAISADGEKALADEREACAAELDALAKAYQRDIDAGIGKIEPSLEHKRREQRFGLLDGAAAIRGRSVLQKEGETG